MLFSNTSRTNSEVREYSESAYAHLDRTARPAFQKVREMLESWANRLPSAEVGEFVQRLTSGDDLLFHSAVLELYMHELLMSTSHAVVFHPEIPGTTKRPDFLATTGNGDETVFECTVATEESSKKRSSNARLNAVYEAINKISCPDFFLSLDIDGTPASPVSGKRWRESIQRWVDSLDYESLVKLGPIPDEGKIPSLDLEHDGLQLKITPIPKKASARGKEGRPIGVQAFEGCWVTSHLEIRDTIKDKASRYGLLHRPYVIVVNCLGEHADNEEISEAMFGHEGLWKNSDSPSHTRVSAVLAVRHLLPWSLGTAEAWLFHNPYATHRYNGPLTVLPQMTQTSAIEGVHPRSLLGIDPQWPWEGGVT